MLPTTRPAAWLLAARAQQGAMPVIILGLQA
jgi:hypothetical protein